jgi:hypothetical protein
MSKPCCPDSNCRYINEKMKVEKRLFTPLRLTRLMYFKQSNGLNVHTITQILPIKIQPFIKQIKQAMCVFKP